MNGEINDEIVDLKLPGKNWKDRAAYYWEDLQFFPSIDSYAPAQQTGLLYQSCAKFIYKIRYVKIEVPFDRFSFIGGLQQAGKLRKSTGLYQIYGITKYFALVPLLGETIQ